VAPCCPRNDSDKSAATQRGGPEAGLAVALLLTVELVVEATLAAALVVVVMLLFAATVLLCAALFELPHAPSASAEIATRTACTRLTGTCSGTDRRDPAGRDATIPT
jgi:hypothetical protein